MEKVIVPVDGSAPSQRAVEFVVARAKEAPGMHIYLVNVQEPPAAEVVARAGVPAENLHVVHQREGMKAMESARKAFDEAKLQYTVSVLVGNVADHILARARELGCTQIVMGTRGRGALPSLVLGSVATRVVHGAACPVTLVK
ncbi:MAG: universal stress protein [Burkholderiales bacterium]|nr:universal stress protein [Burkholderiales bacterium]